MNCVLIEPGDVSAEGVARLRGERARHVLHVLKKQRGDTFLAGMLHGPLGLSTIVEVSDQCLLVTVPEGPTPLVPRTDVILALPRPKVMKRLWAPLASLGLGNITVIGAERVEACYFDSHAVDENLYRPRLIEGLEQARDTRLPVVRIMPSFDRFAARELPSLPGDAIRLIAHPGAPGRVSDSVAGAAPDARIVVAIGPEGGWTPDERAAFVDAGFHEIGLGPRALRTDTAVIALLALVNEAARAGAA